MSRVLLTGGSSPLGDVLVRRLQQDHELIAIARSDAAEQRLRASGVEVVRHDLRDTTELPPLDVHAVVHAAGIGFAELLGPLLRRAAPEHLVVISSASATVPSHPRSAAVIAGEQRLQQLAPQVSVLRPTMIYGSWRDRNVRRLWGKLRRLPIVPRVLGGGLLQPVHSDDVSEAVAESLRVARIGVFPVGGPEPVRFDDVLSALAAATSRRQGGPQLPLQPLARAVSRLPLPSNLVGGQHALEMLLVDRVVPSPVSVGFAFRSTPLFAGMRVAVARYLSSVAPEPGAA